MISLVDLRAEEFNRIRHFFQPKIRVLEIGGGTGYQASLIAASGAIVDSIDVATPEGETYFPVHHYDGRTLPFADGSFDIVFSSNVLEHIADLQTTLSEIHRVMKVEGQAIHILPTPAWRIWTSASHYIHIVKRLAQISGKGVSAGTEKTTTQRKPRRLSGTIKRILMDGPHGEYPSAVSEIWYFSRRRWFNIFRNNGFELVQDQPGGVFYTGYGVFPSLPLRKRRSLSHILGSATRVFILQKAT